MKIRSTLVCSSAILFALAGWFFYRWTTVEIRPSYLKVVEESLVDSSRLLAAILREEIQQLEGDFPDMEGPARFLRNDRFNAKIYDSVKQSSDLEFYIANQNGFLVFHSHIPEEIGADYSQWNDVFLTLRGEYGVRSTRSDPDDPASSRLHVAAPLRNNGEIVGVVTVVKPIEYPFLYIEQSRRHALVGVILLFVAATLLAFGLSWWISKPIERLTAYAMKVRRGERVDGPRITGATEIRKLHEAIDQMRVELEGKKYAETYVANLTHEIKSPLTGLRSAVEILRGDPPAVDRLRFLEHVDAESERIHKIVEHMLLLSTLEGKVSLEREEWIDLCALTDRVMAEYQPLAYARRIKLTLNGRLQSGVVGDEELLKAGIGNLLQNAIEFSPSDGEVRLSLAEEGDCTILQIEDQGTGIPDYAKDRVFDRLYSLPRPDSGKKSSGLGLSLVKEIAELHSSQVSFDCPSEGGTIFRWMFPRIEVPLA
ncbi:MAG: two-component system sensor histidine kinase CreC [Verrucomicrobiota bacterium]